VNCAFPVEGSSPEFQDMVNRAHSLDAKDVPDFKSERFQKATAESRLKLLKRIKIVCDTISLYEKVVTGVHYIGIFGAEDAGKSTFIKVNLIRSHKSPCCHRNFILSGV
jgi:predicted NACHT family NTPase